MPIEDAVSIESFAARTKDSGTIILPCHGANLRGVLESTIAFDLPARAEQKSALRKAFPLGSRVNSLVLLCDGGRRIHLVAPQVIRWEEYIEPPRMASNGQPRVTAADDTPGPEKRVIIVLKAAYGRQRG